VIRRNFIANFGGKLWVGLMSFAFVPVYIRFLGVEVFGLLGFLLSMQGLLSLLDLGLSSAATRECAIGRDAGDPRIADTLRTFEIVYWIVAIATAVLLAVAAPSLAEWVNYNAVDSDYVRRSILVFALAMGTLWPSTLYGAGLTGLERQVAVNIVNALAATARAAGGATVLWLWSPTLEALLCWQALVNAMNTLALRYLLSAAASADRRVGRFSWDALRRTARYSVGAGAVLMLLTVLAQMDKVVLTRVLPLEEFGYYSIGWTLASVLAYLSAPVTTAIFPRLVQAFNANQQQELARLYHVGSQVVGVLVVPAAATLICYAKPVLLLWTHDTGIAAHAASVLQILAAGFALSLLLAMFYLLQAAAGWNRLSFFLQALSVPALAVMLLSATALWGAVGAAGCWVALYVTHLAVGPPLMHRRLLVGEYGQWITADVLKPVVVGSATVYAISLATPAPASMLGAAMVTAAAWLTGVAAQSIVSTHVRERLFSALGRVAAGVKN
jgi:O-antigen/teichoic acid export membrane protein